MFQLAVKRLSGLGSANINITAPLIVTREEHRFLALEQLRETGIASEAFLLEPAGRNTAPALTLAALAAIESGNDPILVVSPSDQTVADISAFTIAMQTAIKEAAAGAIVIFGVTPDRPEAGYGYIQAQVVDHSMGKSLDVKRFIEKPDVATAQFYVDSKNYYWNAGMFVMRASVWLEALTIFRPDMARLTGESWSLRKVDRKTTPNFIRPSNSEFTAIPSESVDYAVMEHCPGSRFKIKMVPLDAGWNDLGSWDAIWNVLPKDIEGNAHQGDVLSIDTSNTLVQASSRLVSLVGVQDLVIIETPDAILIADKSGCQKVKQIVSTLSTQNRQEYTLHRKVHRPWGWYDSIDEGYRFKVKRIQVNPKASLSLQKHHHRAEHWIVVKGTAEITCGEKTIMLGENQSTYIPMGEIHRLANPGDTPLEIIEVQSGNYLEEDDIVRYEDNYGRY